MNGVVYDIGLGNDPVTYDVVLKKDLMSEGRTLVTSVMS